MNMETSCDRIQVGRGRNARVGRGRGAAPGSKFNTKVRLNKQIKFLISEL